MKNYNYTLHDANLADALAIATIGNYCFKSNFKPYFPESFMSEINLQEQIKKCESRIRFGAKILVITDSSHYAVGYASFGKSIDLLYAEENEIYSMYVTPSNQGKGIGTMLLSEVEMRVSRPLFIKLIRDNERSLSFFHKNGYRYVYGREDTLHGIAPTVTYIKKEKDK